MLSAFKTRGHDLPAASLYSVSLPFSLAEAVMLCAVVDVIPDGYEPPLPDRTDDSHTEWSLGD